MRSAVRVIHFNGQGKVSETYTTFGRVMATPQCFTVTDWKCISGKYKRKAASGADGVIPPFPHQSDEIYFFIYFLQLFASLFSLAK